MVLWLIFALLTAIVVGALVRPVLTSGWSSAGPGEAADVASPDADVYRDQLDEIERDAARGLIGAAEAEVARREVARRLLAHAGRTTGNPEQSAGEGAQNGAARMAALGLAGLLPLAAFLTYGLSGSPLTPAMPHAARMAASPAKSSVDELIGRVEARLQQHPEDGAGWDVIAPVYMRQERFAEAAEAYGHALRLVGETAPRLLGFGEATVLANGGAVTPTAREAFTRLLKLAPDRPEARFWLAHAREQDGDLAGAISAYRELLASAPADAAWRDGVVERLADVQRRQGATAEGAAKVAGTAPAPPVARPDLGKGGGPSPADMKAAETMTPADRQRMIESMVDGLAGRLKSNGRDIDGWLRLIRAYKVLGRDPAAVAALADARKAMAGDTAALGALDQLARTLGLGS